MSLWPTGDRTAAQITAAVRSFYDTDTDTDADLAAALSGIRAVLKPGGLFYLGVYGGDAPEEGFSDDGRFFSFRTDHELLTYGKEWFEILDFHVVRDGESRFQSMTLVRP